MLDNYFMIYLFASRKTVFQLQKNLNWLKLMQRFNSYQPNKCALCLQKLIPKVIQNAGLLCHLAILHEMQV